MNQTVKIEKADKVTAEEALDVSTRITDVFIKGVERIFVGNTIVIVYSNHFLDQDHITEMNTKGLEFWNATAETGLLRMEFHWVK